MPKDLTQKQYALYGELLTKFPANGHLIVTTMTKRPQDYEFLRAHLESIRAQAQERVQRLAVVSPRTMADEFINSAGISDGREHLPKGSQPHGQGVKGKNVLY
jgi:hypothetical protein